MNFILLCVALVAISIKFSAAVVFSIGGAFDRNEKLNSVILDYAVQTANIKILSDSGIELKSSTEPIGASNELGAAGSFCRLLEIAKFSRKNLGTSTGQYLKEELMARSGDVNEAAAVPLEMANIVGVFYVLIIGTLFAILYGIVGFCGKFKSKQMKWRFKTEDSDAEELKFENLKGVFLVLLYGTIFACLYGCCEICFCIYKKAKSEKIPFKEEFIAEFKFLLKCKGVKKVRHRKSSKSSTSHRGSNQSRYSGGTSSQAHDSNTLLNLE